MGTVKFKILMTIMNNNQQAKYYDEIDLKDLLFWLWKGKFYIIFVTIASVFLAIYNLHLAERKYTVEYNLKAVGETENSPSFENSITNLFEGS